MINAEIVLDSVAPCNRRLTTFLLTYPRFIHSELMTHRAFSRNAASSRAIPISKMIRTILKSPAMPVSWGQNGKGMQAKSELPRSRVWVVTGVWLVACYIACAMSYILSKFGVHKQLANRLTEPFSHMTTLVTATDLDNFFALRAHKDAQPEFQVLADKMLFAYMASTPKKLKAGEWHLPFVDDGFFWTDQDKLKASVARCARTSYVTMKNKSTLEKDIALHDQLLSSGHMSPFEHQGMAMSLAQRCGNFMGFGQYRYMVPNQVRELGKEGLQKLHSDRKALAV